MEQEYSPQLLGQVMDAVIVTFGANMSPEDVKKKESAFQELLAKTVSFADKNNLQLSPQLVSQYPNEILAMPNPMGEDGIMDNFSGEETVDYIQEKISSLRKDTNDTFLYVLFAFAILALSILFEKLHKVVAIMILVIVVVLAFKHFSKAKDQEPIPDEMPDSGTSATTEAVN